MLKERLRKAMDGPPKVTQIALARACGVSGPAVNDWLSGKSKTMRGEYLMAVARQLGVSADWLASGAGAMRPLHSEVSEITSVAGAPRPFRPTAIDHATMAQAKRWVLAEETLAGPYAHDELVNEVIAVYELMQAGGGDLTNAQRLERVKAVQARAVP